MVERDKAIQQVMIAMWPQSKHEVDSSPAQFWAPFYPGWNGGLLILVKNRHCWTVAFCPITLVEMDMYVWHNTDSYFSTLVFARSPRKGCLAQPGCFHMEGCGVKAAKCLATQDKKKTKFDIGYDATTSKQDNLGVHLAILQWRKSALLPCLH